MRFLITGGAGFIGSHLAERLVRERLGSVVVLDNLHRGNTRNLSSCWDQVSFVRSDIRDAPLVEEVTRGCTHVFHLASQSNVMGAVEQPDYTLSSNVTGTHNVLQAARRARVTRVVFASSREVYGESTVLPVPEDAPLLPKNLYGVSKLTGELLCPLFVRDGLETVVLRLANVYGSRDIGRVIPLFVEKAITNQALSIYGGRQTLDLVWIETVVEALMRAALDQRFIEEPVNVGSGKGVAITELVRRILEATQSKSRVEFLQARDNEVVGFVADIRRAQEYFALASPEDPLAHLIEVVDWVRAARNGRSGHASDLEDSCLEWGVFSEGIPKQHPLA
jgi:UDP-glucose 4-epimerase